MNSRAPDPAFKLEGVSRRFGEVAALVDLSLEVTAGQRVALVGPSGAGKTTLIRLLNGSLSPSEGELRLLGRNPADVAPAQLRAVQRRIGTVYQQYHLVRNLRVIHNVNAGHLGEWSLAKSAFSLIWPREVAAARDVLRRVGIPDKLEERTGDLSGGQQQRVAIARVLAQDPEVILADEPIASVDPGRSLAIMDLLRDLSEGLGKTLVVSLHSVEFALSHCDRLIGLRSGRLVFDAEPKAVTPSMVGALYQLDGRA